MHSYKINCIELKMFFSKHSILVENLHLWIGHKSIKGQRVHTQKKHTNQEVISCSQLNHQHGFEDWEETSEPRENPHGHI